MCVIFVLSRWKEVSDIKFRQRVITWRSLARKEGLGIVKFMNLIKIEFTTLNILLKKC